MHWSDNNWLWLVPSHFQQIKMSSMSVSIGHQNIPYFWPVVYIYIYIYICMYAYIWIISLNLQVNIRDKLRDSDYEFLCDCWIPEDTGGNIKTFTNQGIHACIIVYTYCVLPLQSLDIPLGTKPLRTYDAYMRHWTGSSVVQIMACRLCGAKPLPAPMLTHCQLDHWKQNVTENSNRISNIVMILTTKRNCYVCNTFHLFGSCLAWMIFVHINTLRPTRNRHHFADDIFKCIF